MQRLQQINGDTVLEVTEEVKRRLSENDLLRQKEQLEQAIAKFQNRLEQVNADIALVTTAKNEAAA